VVAVIVVAVALMPWNALRGPIARYASARFDRPVAIAGNLDVRLGRLVRVQAEDVTVGNVSWSQEQPMASARRVVLWFRWRSLLGGAPSRIRFEQPNITLERNAHGDDNWHFGKAGGDAVPRIGNIEVDHGVVRYRDAIAKADVTLDVTTADTPDARASLRFGGEGTLRGERIALSGTSLGLAQLQEVDDPYALTLDVKSGGTHVQFDGTVVPSNAEDLHGKLLLAGPDLSKLYPILPAALPWTPPYKLSGTIAHTDDVWSYTAVTGVVGDSDLAGTLTVDNRPKRSLVTADLSSKRFDYKDLGGFVGLPPGEVEKRAKTGEQRAQEAKREVSTRALPDKPIEVAKLREHDAEVTFRGKTVQYDKIPLDNLTARLSLKEGVLRFAPLDFGVADGHVLANVTLDARRDVPAADADITIHNVELKRIFPQLKSPQGTAGRFGGRARFRTQGRSVAALFAAADGDAAVIMRGGEASTLTLVLTNLDLANAAALLLRGDETAVIRCAVGQFRSRRGVMTPDMLVVDTSAELITGEGTIDFVNERYDLALRANSKHASLIALRGPVVVGGTFKHPSVHPAVGPVVLRVGAAIGLGVLAPPLALLPLIDFGGAPDADCRGLMQEARLNSGMKDKPRTAQAGKAVVRN
jgi:uncharacterized protein involved in outer membrane biogenesis